MAHLHEGPSDAALSGDERAHWIRVEEGHRGGAAMIASVPRQTNQNLPIRLGGVSLIGGAVAFGVAMVVISSGPVGPTSISSQVGTLLLIAGWLLVLSLPALYAVQAEATGSLGLAAHALLSTGLIILLLVSATPVLHPTADLPLPEDPLLMVLGVAFTVGLLLTGIATWRAAVLPRAAAGLVLAAMAGFGFDFFIAELLSPIAGQLASLLLAAMLTIGFGWLGLAMWRGVPAR
jgi:hypothetical protein